MSAGVVDALALVDELFEQAGRPTAARPGDWGVSQRVLELLQQGLRVRL